MKSTVPQCHLELFEMGCTRRSSSPSLFEAWGPESRSRTLFHRYQVYLAKEEIYRL